MIYNTLKYFIDNINTNQTLQQSAHSEEFRTIKLNMPRRSGKTMALNRLSEEYSSLLITTTYTMSMQLHRGKASTTLDSILRHTLGNKSNGLKYRCILIDEYTTIDLNVLITNLQISNMLEKNFVIIQVGTGI